MSYFEVLKEIKKNKIAPLYLLHGTETKLAENIKKQVIEKTLTTEDRDTSLSTYDLEETSIQEVIEDAETYPFFGEKKIIIAHNPSFLKARPDKSAVEHNLDVFQNYINEPAPYTVLILIAPYEKLDERKKIIKSFKKTGKLVACQPVKEWEINKWVEDMALGLKVETDPGVVDLIVEETGTDLQMLQNELEKMAIYIGENGRITRAVAEELISHQSNTSGLKLVDAVMEKNLQKAITIYKDLEKLKEEPVALVALLSSQFRTILHAKLLRQKGYSQQQMAQQLRVHPYVIKMSLQRERNFSLQELESIMSSITETDGVIKQGKMEKSLAFEMLLYELITKRIVSA